MELCKFRKTLKDDRLVSIGFLLYMVLGTRIHQKNIVYTTDPTSSPIFYLAVGLLCLTHWIVDTSVQFFQILIGVLFMDPLHGGCIRMVLIRVELLGL